MIRTMLSESLAAVISQALLKKEGGGRVAAYEIMVVNHAITNLIREGKIFQIPSIIQTGKKEGMILMEQSIIDIVQKGIVSKEEASAYLDNPAVLNNIKIKPTNAPAAPPIAKPDLKVVTSEPLIPPPVSEPAPVAPPPAPPAKAAAPPPPPAATPAAVKSAPPPPPAVAKPTPTQEPVATLISDPEIQFEEISEVHKMFREQSEDTQSKLFDTKAMASTTSANKPPGPPPVPPAAAPAAPSASGNKMPPPPPLKKAS
jgi:hypothetical protein